MGSQYFGEPGPPQVWSCCIGTAKTAPDSRCVMRGLVFPGELFPHPCRQQLCLDGQGGNGQREFHPWAQWDSTEG